MELFQRKNDINAFHQIFSKSLVNGNLFKKLHKSLERMRNLLDYPQNKRVTSSSTTPLMTFLRKLACLLEIIDFMSQKINTINNSKSFDQLSQLQKMIKLQNKSLQISFIQDNYSQETLQEFIYYLEDLRQLSSSSYQQFDYLFRLMKEVQRIFEEQNKFSVFVKDAEKICLEYIRRSGNEGDLDELYSTLKLMNETLCEKSQSKDSIMALLDLQLKLLIAVHDENREEFLHHFAVVLKLNLFHQLPHEVSRYLLLQLFQFNILKMPIYREFCKRGEFNYGQWFSLLTLE